MNEIESILRQFKQLSDDHELIPWLREKMEKLVAERDAEVREEMMELYEALQLMWEQYCPEPFTHKYMTAGENCEEVLSKYSHLTPTKETLQDKTGV